MTKPKGVFKKRKNVGKLKSEVPQASTSTARQSREMTSSTPSSRSSSIFSSSKKLDSSLNEYDEKYESNKRYDIIDIEHFFNSVLKVMVRCRLCNGKIHVEVHKRVGLSCQINTECLSCNTIIKYNNAQPMRKQEGEQLLMQTYDINARFVLALRAIGKGPLAGKTFCSVMNLPSPTKRPDTDNILGACKAESTKSMTQAVEEAVVANEDDRKLAIALDGTWQKRGHTSINGVVTATSVDNGKIVDISIKSKFCHCPERASKVHLQNCTANYMGASGGMEVQSVLDIFRQSEDKYGVQYTKYLGDGDTKSFKAVAEANVYGSDLPISKLECIGHVQKRMGTRLRSLKNSTKGPLSDGKPIGGKNRLTEDAINKIQKYYGLAIRRNTSNVEEMRKAVWAEYFHISASDENPSHALCPSEENSWCKYKKAKAQNQTYEHKKHFHLAQAIMVHIKPIFRQLADPELLKKCTHRGTQNPNKSANNVIWTFLPKNVFIQIKTLELGVHMAVGSFNDGHIFFCRVLKRLGMEPGHFCCEGLRKLDLQRIRNANRAVQAIVMKSREKRSRARRNLEDGYQEEEMEEPSYVPGGY